MASDAAAHERVSPDPGEYCGLSGIVVIVTSNGLSDGRTGELKLH